MLNVQNSKVAKIGYMNCTLAIIHNFDNSLVSFSLPIEPQVECGDLGIKCATKDIV